MKRKIGIFLLSAVLAISCCAFAACNNKKGSNEIRIADFETYEELTEMRWLNQFGAAELSGEHVTHGEQSLHVSVMGKLNAAAKPVICIDTKTDRLAKYDFTDVDRFKLDVYNDNDYDANVYFQYLTAAENQNKTSGEIKATVPAKTAKTVEFVIDRALSAYFLNLDDVLQLRIAFDPIEEYGQAYRSFYIDNLRAYTTSETFAPASPRKADEIESCDRPEYLAAWGNILSYVYSPSSLTFNSDPAYIKAGAGSFKLMSERTGGSGELYTIGIACINDPLADFSTYAGLGYWVYNPNDIAIPAWLTGNYYMGELQPGEWTYLEVTQAMFKQAQNGNHNADPTSLENFGPMFQVPDDKNYTLYIDEMYALKDGMEPVITVEEFVSEYPETGLSVTVPKATVKYADEYTVKVYDPDGVSVGENIESFTAEKYGVYELLYTATARRADAEGNRVTAEERVYITVGTTPAFQEIPEKAVFSDTDEYTVVPPVSEDGTVTWRAEVINAYYPCYDHVLLGTIRDVDTDGYTDGVKEGTGTGTVKGYEGAVVRITYRVSNSQNLYATAVQTVFYLGAEKKLASVYSDLYTAGKTSGDLSVLTDKESMFGENGGLRLQSETGEASGTFTPAQNVYLGASNNNLRFVVYNNGSKPVSFTVNGNGQPTYELAAGHSLVFNGVMYGYEAALQGWKIVSKDKYLLPLTFAANSSGAVDLYIGYFTVNGDSFTPTAQTDYAETYDLGELIDVKTLVTVFGASEFSYDIYRKRPSEAFDGSKIVKSGNSTDADTTYVLNGSGDYKVVYTVPYRDGNTDKTITVSAEFRVLSREITFTTPPTDQFAQAGTITVVNPGSEYGNVTWEIELLQVKSHYQAGDNDVAGVLAETYSENGWKNGLIANSPATFYLPENYAARIKFTVTDSADDYNTAIAYQTYVNFTDSTLLSETYPDLYKGATLTGMSKSEDFAIFGNRGETLHIGFAGAQSADIVFAPPADTYLGASNANVRFVVYNNGSKRTLMKENTGNGFYILPGCYAVFSAKDRWGYDALKGWGVVDANGNLGTLKFSITTDDGADTDLYIGYFTVNEDSFRPTVTISDFGTVTAGTQIDVREHITVSGGIGYSYSIVYSKTEDGGTTEVAKGTSEGTTTYTPNRAGWYTVACVVSYGNGQTVEASKKFQVTGRTLTFQNLPQNVFVSEGSYTIAPPASEQGTVSWKAELFEIFFPGQYGQLRSDINAYGYVNGVKTGSADSEDMTVFVFENHAVRITYTVTDSLDETNTRNAYQTVINFTDNARLSDTYENFYTGAALTDDLTLLSGSEMFGDGGFGLRNDSAQGATYSATGTVTPAENAKYLGVSNKNLRFVVYNNGTSAVTLNGPFGGNNPALQPHMSAVFNGGIYGDAALVGWQIITADRNLNALTFTATSDAPVDVWIGCFTVNGDSFTVRLAENQENKLIAAGTHAIDPAEVFGKALPSGSVSWHVKKYDVDITFGSSILNTETAIGDANGKTDSPESFRADAGYTYEITYTVSAGSVNQTFLQRLAVQLDGTPFGEKLVAGETVTGDTGSLSVGGTRLLTYNPIAIDAENLSAGCNIGKVELSSIPENGGIAFWVMFDSQGDCEVCAQGTAGPGNTPVKAGRWYLIKLDKAARLYGWNILQTGTDTIAQLYLRCVAQQAFTVYADGFTVY